MIMKKMKTKILFVCLGNICRSPMAEFIMKKLVADAGLADRFDIASAATSYEEQGNPVYPPARKMLAAHGIDCSGKTARRITAADYEHYDYIIAMDKGNLRSLHAMLGDDPADKISLLMDYTDHPREIADPWYTRDFETAWREISEGCEALLRHLTE